MSCLPNPVSLARGEGFSKRVQHGGRSRLLPSHTMSRLAPFFSYYGSKHRIARRYPPPVTGHIIEPFAGSAAYACCYPHLNVTLCEANPKVAGVWDFLIRAPESEIRALPLLDKAEGVAALGDAYPQEAKWLVGFWLAKGRGAPFINPSAWRRAKFDLKEYEGSFWSARVRQRLAAQVRRIRHWKIVCADYSSCPSVRACWFVDPPYSGRAGRAYNAFGSHKLNYGTLATWCLERAGQVIVCESTAAEWMPFVPFADAYAMNGTHRSGVSREAVWHRSDEPPVQGDLLSSLARAG